MPETLGSLCDKLTIIKLKQYHSKDQNQLQNLQLQEQQLSEEVNGFLAAAVAGEIPSERLTFFANKVFKKEGNGTRDFSGSVGTVFAELASLNCRLWHEQENVYDFAAVPAAEKNKVINRLAVLNLERNKCIDAIDRQFQQMILARTK